MAIGGAPFLAPTLPHGPPTEEKNAGAGLTPRAVGGRNAAPSYTASRHVRLQGGRPISNRGWSEAEPAEHTHPTCIASKRRACHAPPRAWRPHHLPCTNFGKAQVRLRLGKVRKTKLSLTFLSPCTNFGRAQVRLRLGKVRKTKLSLTFLLPCTNFGRAQVRLRLGKVRKTKLSLTFLSPCTNFAGPRTMVCAD